MKNQLINDVIEKRIIRLTTRIILIIGALRRITAGASRVVPFASMLAAIGVGILLVGLSDSRLDDPRVVWLFYFPLLLACTLSGRRHPALGSPLHHMATVLACLALVAGLGLRAKDAKAQNASMRTQLISVGPEREIKTLAEASRLARSGAVIEVDAGEYVGDVAVWNQDALTVRAVGGRVKLVAAGEAAEGKAIWVMRGGQMSVDGFDFSGARVPDRNGAGIRLEKGKLQIRNCRFMENENGILTGNQPDTELEIENSEFGYNGYGDGQSHNLYAGAIARLSVTGSYFHHANVGHLLKSRAAVNRIFYNRLSDESGGRASYELEFAIGGIAYVVGNIIQQSSQTENPHLISYGAEGYKWPRNGIYLVNNTFVNDRSPGGVFLRVGPGDVTIRAVNNLLVGKGRLETAGSGEYRNNYNVSHDDIDPAGDYRLKARSTLRGGTVVPQPVDGINLQPDAEYTYPTGTRAIIGKTDLPGALQANPANQRR